MDRRSHFDPFLLSLLLAALLLRGLGLWFGLPCPVFSDESHHINLAVSFGGGHFNPHIFKYPTLWMYLLFTLYSSIFLFWSGFGLFRSTADFASLFVWHPTWFYLPARMLGALAGTLTVYFIYRSAEKLFRSRRAAIISGALAAFSPPLVFYAHQAKPDSLMVFFVSAALFFLIRHEDTREIRDFYVASALLGLACSTQYMAALAVPFLFFPGLMRMSSAREEFRFRASKTTIGFLLVGFFFILGSPFILFDWRTFLGDLMALRSYGAGALTAGSGRLGLHVVKHFANAMGPTGFGIFALGAMILQTLIRPRRKTVVLLAPLLWGSVFLALQSQQASVINYAFALFPFLFILAGTLGRALEDVSGALAAVLVAALLLPGAIRGAGVSAQFLTVDTRLQATQWIEENIPTGTTVLLDQPHTGPNLYPTREQAERLLAITKSKGNLRWRYYDAMIRKHPGGGYNILRVDRTWKELISPLERQTEAAREAYEWLDVESGMAPVQKAGVQFVVWSGAGATRANSPRLLKYFDELDSQAKLVKEFEAKTEYSPNIKIYAVNPIPANAKK